MMFLQARRLALLYMLKVETMLMRVQATRGKAAAMVTHNRSPSRTSYFGLHVSKAPHTDPIANDLLIQQWLA